MNKAWLVGVVLACATPSMVLAQFGGSAGGYGYSRPTVLDVDKEVTPRFEPIIVLEARSRQALQHSVQLLDSLQIRADYENQPLAEVIASLERAAGFPIEIDAVAREEKAGIGRSARVNLHCNASLRKVLERVCEPHELTSVPHGAGLLITTQDEANVHLLVTVVYPVSDLVSTPQGDDYDSLIELLTSTLEPNLWKEGGTGEATLGPYSTSGALVVNAPWKLHELISPLLAALRESKTKQGIRGVRHIEAPSASDDTSTGLPQARGRQRNRWAAGGASPGRQ